MRIIYISFKKESKNYNTIVDFVKEDESIDLMTGVVIEFKIIDGFYDLPPGNIPVFFKNNFEGIIEKGTPIAQILPFKTENWLSQTDKEILEKSQINDMFAATKIFGWYKKNIWKKKSYE